MVATILDSRGDAGAVEHSRRCGAAAMRCDASSGDLRNARISIERELQYRKRTDDTQDLQDDTSLAHSLLSLAHSIIIATHKESCVTL